MSTTPSTMHQKDRGGSKKSSTGEGPLASADNLKVTKGHARALSFGMVLAT